MLSVRLPELDPAGGHGRLGADLPARRPGARLLQHRIHVVSGEAAARGLEPDHGDVPVGGVSGAAALLSPVLYMLA